MNYKKRLGVILFWLGWPAFRLILPLTKRTRCAIFYKNELLVVQPWLSNGKWGLPGGGIKFGESPIDGVIREVYEETNIKFDNKKCQNLGEFIYTSSGLRFKYQLFGVTLTKKPEVSRQVGEIIDIAWINIDKINPNNSSSDVLKGVKQL